MVRSDAPRPLATIETEGIVSKLVALTFIRSHVAAARVLRIGTRLTALIGIQQITLAVGAATRVACINRRASREESHGLGRSAVVLHGPELGVGIVQVATAVKIAGAIAAQVVAT